MVKACRDNGNCDQSGTVWNGPRFDCMNLTPEECYSRTNAYLNSLETYRIDLTDDNTRKYTRIALQVILVLILLIISYNLFFK